MVRAPSDTSAATQGGRGYQLELLQPEDNQLLLYENSPFAENPSYLSNQLITYIGNKRALLEQIGKAVMCVKKRTGKQHLRVFDAFSGSGVVSRF